MRLSRLHQKRLFWSVGLFSMLSVAVILILIALKQNINLFYAPSELAAVTLPTTQKVRLGGQVLPGSFVKTPGSLKVSFSLTDGAATIPVHYEGMLPDLFREGQGIITEGVYDGAVFQASYVLAKHDENYSPSTKTT